MDFLDFECEACGAAYPIVETLREEYGDEVTFGIRYFPIPSHSNAERAARAVESAARQGQLTGMYRYVTLHNLQSGVMGSRVARSATVRRLRDGHALLLTLVLLLVLGLALERFWGYWVTLV